MSNSLYLISDSVTGEILYIGITKRDVELRIQEHLQAAEKLSLFPLRDLVLAAHYLNLEYDIPHTDLDRETALWTEKELIK